MPNYVTINLTIAGKYSEVDAFLQKHITDNDSDTPGREMDFDFETIIPMPEALRGTTSPTPKSELPMDVKRREKEFGFSNWYDWSNHNWGTKWNACDTDLHNIIMAEGAKATDEVQAVSLGFQTAWSFPEPIFRKLMEMYPTLSFDIECVEEGGFFSGKVFISNGEYNDMLVYDNMDHWRNDAAEILGYSFDEEGNIC